MLADARYIEDVQFTADQKVSRMNISDTTYRTAPGNK